MEEEGVGIVLARAFELRSKITNCINRATSVPDKPHNAMSSQEDRQAEGEGGAHPSLPPSPDEDSDADVEEAQALLDIRDALESLEAQLSSLQTLQQQHRFEKEAALAEIDYSRKLLLDRLREYRGKDLEVIREASAFASETVEHSNDLLLPPYPSYTPRPLILDNGFMSQSHNAGKLARNGILTRDPTNEMKKNFSELGRSEKQTVSKNPITRIAHFVTAAAKTVITLVGVVSVLNLAGFEPWLMKRDTHLKVLSALLKPETEEKRSAQCPPGKVLVMEDGEARCLVKERVEVPFESLVTKPDVSYGCG